MTSRRVVIGKYADGVTFGLKVALPGYDALAEADDSANLSFNSNWSDIVPIIQTGIASIPSGGTSTTVLVTDPGYVPYLEGRKFDSGTTIHDDYLYGATNRIGISLYWIQRSPLTFCATFTNIGAGDPFIYVVFGTPVVLT